MTSVKTNLYNFLRHLAEKNYARCQNDLSQIIEEKLKSKAAMVKAKNKMSMKKKTSMKGK
jgi:hypothetical protein